MLCIRSGRRWFVTCAGLWLVVFSASPHIDNSTLLLRLYLRFNSSRHVRRTICRLCFCNPFQDVLRNQTKGLTANYNRRIMVIYANVDKCRLGFCPGLRLHLFRIASGSLICKPFYALIFWQSVKFMQLLPVVILASVYLTFYGLLLFTCVFY